MQFRVIVLTDLQTHRQGRLQYAAPQLARSVINLHRQQETAFLVEMYSK